MHRVGAIVFAIQFWICLIIVTTLNVAFRLFFISTIKRQISRRASKVSVLYLENFPEDNAGYAYRAKKWAEVLNASGFSVKIKNIYDRDRFESLTKRSHPLFIAIFQWRRFLQVLTTFSYDIVIVRRELLLYHDYGSLFMDKLLLSINRNVVLDFDDDISAAKNEPRKIGIYGHLLLEKGDKFSRTLSLYNNFICGSNHLSQLVTEQNPNAHTVEIPTCVDYVDLPPVEYDDNIGHSVKIGWIGSNGNQKYLAPILACLEEVSKETRVELVVISGSLQFESSNYSFPVSFERWSSSTQIDSLRKISIGVMPLPDNRVSEGKCGFKLLQYMGLGIVSIASPVGVNNKIIQDGKNGFLVTDDDWVSTFHKCLAENHRFSEISMLARKTVEQSYSFDANRDKYINFVSTVLST